MVCRAQGPGSYLHQKLSADCLDIGLVHICWLSQVTFPFGAFLGQDVAVKGLSAADGTASGHFKPLGRSAMGLHFGHVVFSLAQSAPVLFTW